MSLRRLLVPVSIFAVMAGGAAIVLSQSAPDPLADYRSMQRRAGAGPRGSMIAAARGEVVSVPADNLFQIQSDDLFPERLWVLSRSPRDVSVGAHVAVQGTLFADGLRGVDSGVVPDDVEPELCREGVLVADTLTIYRGQMRS